MLAFSHTPSLLLYIPAPVLTLGKQNTDAALGSLFKWPGGEVGVCVGRVEMSSILKADFTPQSHPFTLPGHGGEAAVREATPHRVSCKPPV